MPLGIASLFVLFILAVIEKAKDFSAMNIVMLTNTYAPHVGAATVLFGQSGLLPEVIRQRGQLA